MHILWCVYGMVYYPAARGVNFERPVGDEVWSGMVILLLKNYSIQSTFNVID